MVTFLHIAYSKCDFQIFTGLQRKLNRMIQFANPVNQPFRLDPFPNNQQKRRWRGFLFARGRSGKQLFSKPVSAAQNGNVQSAELSSYTSSDKK